MLYYLTGMATERSAVLAYNLLHEGVSELGEAAVADTIVRARSAARSRPTTPSTRCPREGWRRS